MRRKDYRHPDLVTLDVRARFDLKAAADGPEGTFVGLAAVFSNIDRQGDIIKPGAFRETLKNREQPIRLLWQHNPHAPIGIIEDARETDQGLEIKGRIATQTQLGRDAHELMKMGAIDSFSIGFMIPSGGATDEEVGGRPVRVIHKVDLWEVSLVTFPANPSALLSDVKAVVPFQNLPLAPRDRAWSASAAVRRVRAWAGAEDAPNERYRRAFLWYDRENADNFGAYKLPIADVIDGTLTAVPRAIFAAAAVMRGGRGGVQIPNADRDQVRAHISRYYAKMRDAFNDESIVPPWDKGGPGPDEFMALAQSLETEREVEQYLLDVGFSRKQAKAMVAGWKAAVAGRDDGDTNGVQGNAGDPEPDDQRDAGVDGDEGVAEALRELVEAVRRAAGTTAEENGNA